MPDRFTLLTFSFCFILHNVCCWNVSEPLNHTFNDDDSVSVTCMLIGEEKFHMEAKLKMNDEYICEIYNKNKEPGKYKDCTWQHKDNKFTFTLKNPEGLHKNTFSCEIFKVKPIPITHKKGPKIKLFRGCNKSSAPPMNSCPIANQTNDQDHRLVESHTPEEMYTLLICGLIIVVVMLCLYSIILTAVFIRLRATKPESSDTLTYVPMQRKVNRRDLDNTEYVDMREVQKRGGSHRDMNHNSHFANA
ncbi:uncharacterized protein LOC132094683 [Carassius carassius]|uniref:uncharacterized protein LOC132094683 n=1 Tax=Carassius carassius TaxID=217509 RepID=UPI002868A663|nr:uncharacterized protein LOC132094683 [Carassius carassius]